MIEQQAEDLFRDLMSGRGATETNILEGAGQNKPANFIRNTTLDEDIQALMEKWYGTPNDILVQHMYDSLVIFNHNRKNITRASKNSMWWGNKFKTYENDTKNI